MKKIRNIKNLNIFYIIVIFTFVSGCATYEVGKSPLTEAEITNIQNADPNAFKINYINDVEFDVTNTTFIDPLADIARWVQISEELDKYPIFRTLIKKNSELADKNCQAKDMIVKGIGLPNKFSTRYKCLSYIDSSYEFVKEHIAHCGSGTPYGNYLVNSERFSHPCYPNEGRSIKYCKTYSELFEIYPGQVVSCKELKQKRDKALYKQNVDSTIQYQSPRANEKSFDFVDAEKKCAELGFKTKSEKFADCVIKLSR